MRNPNCEHRTLVFAQDGAYILCAHCDDTWRAILPPLRIGDWRLGDERVAVDVVETDGTVHAARTPAIVDGVVRRVCPQGLVVRRVSP